MMMVATMHYDDDSTMLMMAMMQDDDDPDDDDEYRTSPKQLPVIKKLKKQGRTIKPFSPQGNLCRLHRTLVFVM